MHRKNSQFCGRNGIRLTISRSWSKTIKRRLAWKLWWKPRLGPISRPRHVQSAMPKEKRYSIAIYTHNSYDALVMGTMKKVFGYGGEMGDYDTNQVEGMTNSKESVEGLKLYKELYKVCPPDCSKAFFLEASQAFT